MVFVGRFLADWWLVITGGSCHKDHFYRDKKTFFVATKLCLSRQTYFCRDKRLSRQIFIATNVILLTRQAYFCRDKHLSQQKFCRGKHTFVVTKGMFCCDKHVFVTTNTCLSRQKLYLWQLPPMIVGQPQDDKGSVT